MTDSYAHAKSLAIRYPFTISQLLIARRRMKAHLLHAVGVPKDEVDELSDEFVELACAMGTAAGIGPAQVFEKLTRKPS